MINVDTIISSFNEQGTLLKWLKKLTAALGKGALKGVDVINLPNNEVSLKFIFADGTFIESQPLAIGGGGTIDAFDLLNLIDATGDVICDINEAGNKVEIHLDQLFKDNLATKEALQLKADKTQIEPLETAIGQHTISIENLKKEKQDKLSQVDLDNIAMINQYGNDIKQLKSDVNIIDNITETILITITDEDVKNGFLKFGDGTLTNLTKLINESNKNTKILQKIKINYKGTIIEEAIVLNDYFQRADLSKGFNFSTFQVISQTEPYAILNISGCVMKINSYSGIVIEVKIDTEQKGGGGGAKCEIISLKKEIIGANYSFTCKLTQEDYEKILNSKIAFLKIDYSTIKQNPFHKYLTITLNPKTSLSTAFSFLNYEGKFRYDVSLSLYTSNTFEGNIVPYNVDTNEKVYIYAYLYEIVCIS